MVWNPPIRQAMFISPDACYLVPQWLIKMIHGVTKFNCLTWCYTNNKAECLIAWQNSYYRKQKHFWFGLIWATSNTHICIYMPSAQWCTVQTLVNGTIRTPFHLATSWTYLFQTPDCSSYHTFIVINCYFPRLRTWETAVINYRHIRYTIQIFCHIYSLNLIHK